MGRFVVEVEVEASTAGEAAQFVAFALQEQDMDVVRIRAEAAPVVPVKSGRTFAEGSVKSVLQKGRSDVPADSPFTSVVEGLGYELGEDG